MKPPVMPPSASIVMIAVTASVDAITDFARLSHGVAVGYSNSALAVAHSPQRT